MIHRVVYKAAPGAPFPRKDAPLIGQHLEQLERVSGGGITPTVIVRDAKKPRSPLHKYFDWDVQRAAERHWLQQARLIINHLVVEIECVRGKKPQSLKGFHSVEFVVDDEKERSYASLATVDNDEDLREQVVSQALKMLDYWQMRYGQLEELWEINKAINRAKKKRTRKRQSA